MTFGWQGFSLEHPDDWAPVHFTGDRREGYVRIASPGKLACQLRWKTGEATDSDLTDRLRTYLERLERDAKKARQPFDADIDLADGGFRYRYNGFTNGKGTIFARSGRVFFLETISPKNEASLSLYRSIADSFECPPVDHWALLGLHIRIPVGLSVSRNVLEAGHIRLDLQRRGVSVRAERWGFGEQLVAKHGLANWAHELLRLPVVESSEPCGRVKLARRGLTPTSALVVWQREQNQLIVLSVASRRKEWTPQWDWIV